MTKYIISVLIAAVSLSIAELVLPKGKLNGVVKAALSVIFLSVMLAPIVDLDVSNSFDVSYDYSETQTAFENYFSGKISDYYAKLYMMTLKNCDLIAEKIDVEISGGQVKKIDIYLSNLVIEENNEHINITVITEYVAEKLSVGSEIVNIYV